MTAHAILGASSMHRWAKCPGSIRESAGLENATSRYAEEGTQAHEVAAWCLEHGTRMPPVAAPTYPEGMANAVNTYLDHIAAERKPHDIEGYEHKFDLSSVYPGCFGTCDQYTWRASEGLLIVRDYKHGAGIPVEAVNNSQLQYYALGALMTLGYPARRVRMEIIQPRCDHPDGPVRAWEIDAIDLLDFRADLIAYAQATEAPDAPLNPGEWCRFCPAVRQCPALHQRQQLIAKTEFSPQLSYDPVKLQTALDALPAVEARIKAIRQFAYDEAEAGRTAPGYKLVAKRATRKWRDGANVDLMQRFDIPTCNKLYEPPALKSPAQAEKILGKGKIDDLVIAESSGHVLAPVDDRRPPVKLTAKEEFARLPFQQVKQ